MADVNANIGVHIDTSAALVELKNLQRQLANFHSSVAKSSAASAAAQKNLQTNLLNSINATGKFSAQMGNVRTSTESFTHALETNKLSMREYFRYAGGSTRTFGRLFKQEFDTIGKVAQERVKTMQTQYIKMGRDASGAMKAMSIRPTTLNMNDYATKTALAAQKQALLNQLLKQGSTNLLNFGKNTQWAGRQLMVGFTVPLAYFGSMAAKTFMDLEKQAIRFKRVYGDMFTTTDETNKALADIQKLAEEFTKYGVAVVDTMEMAANAAAMGKTGADLTAQVAEATRLAVLGGVEQAQALETTISVTNAFGIAAEDLAKKVDFLNAVENQTVVSIEDLTIAIPKAGPVVKQLGGDVEDLAFFLTAMKEGGINASEGANALKSGLASLINPTEKASKMLAGFGVNINAIVESNQGNIRQTVIDFSRALDTLDPLNRARAIEQLFGKFQFSRLSTLFQNVTKDGTQASRVLNLAAASVEELAILSERELGVLEDAIGTDFKESIEKLKLAIAPIGKEFLKAITPVAKAIGEFLEKFNNLGDGTKKFIVIATTLVGVIGPVLLMTFGLLANGVANIIKLFITMRSGFLKAGTNSSILAQQTSYLNTEQLEAASVAASLNQAHTKLTQSFTIETSAVRLLRQAYIDATIAATNFARANPGMMMPGRKGSTPKKFARGTTYVPGKGNKDNVPAVLMPGEAVIPKDIAQDPRFQPIIDAMVNGNLQGFENGTVFAHAVNNRVISGSSVPANIQGAGFKSANAYSAIGFDVLRETNSRLNVNRMLIDDYRREISNPMATQTMVGRLMAPPNNVSARDAYKVTEKIRANLLSSLEKIPSGTFIGDKDVYSRMGNARTGILGGIIQKSRGGSFGSAVSKLLAPTAFSPRGKPTAVMNGVAPIQNVIDAVKKTKTNQSALRALVNLQKADPSLRIPVKIDSAGNITGYQRPELSKKTGKPTTTMNAAVLDGDRFRPGRVDRGGGRQIRISPKTRAMAAQVIMGKGEILNTTDNRSTVVTGQTGTAKKPGTAMVGGGPGDRRAVPASKVKSVIPRGYRGAPMFGFGAEDGLNQTTLQPGKALSEVEKQFRSEQKSLRRQIQKVEKERIKALKEETRVTQQKTRAVQQNVSLTQTQSKEQKREARAQRAQRVGRVAGPVASIAGIGAMAGFATGNSNVGMAMTGVAALSSIAPQLTNPLGLFVAGLVGVTALIYKFNKDMEKAREEGVNLAKSMNMTSGKLQKLSETAGTVSASEKANKKRESILTGEDAVQRKFGQNILGSDFGKGLLADIETQAKSGQGIEEIGKNISNSLAYAIVQGVITTDQARSISSALGEELKSYEIPAIISGRLTNLLGPNGENLATDPLKITLAIQEESMTRQADFFKTALENIKPTVGLSPTQTILGAAGVGALGGAAIGALGGPLAPVTATGGAIAGGIVGAIGGVGASFSEKGARESNANLGAAALQLGLEQVTMNNGLVDSLNKQYDIKVKMAKTDAEIKKIEDERKAALDTLNAKNAEALNLLIAQKDAFGPEIFTKGINSAIDTLYKDGPMKVFADEAKKELEGIKDADFKAMLQVQFASGSLDPVTIMKLANNEELQSRFTVLVEEKGSENANLIMQLLMKAGISDTKLPIFMDIINKDPENFDKNMNAISVFSNMRQKYGITINLNDDGVAQIEEVVRLTEMLKAFGTEELTQEQFFNLNMGGVDNLTKEEKDVLWKTLVGSSKTIGQQVIIDFVAAGDVNAVDKYMAAKGIKVATGPTDASDAAAKAAQRKSLEAAAAAYLVGRQGKLDPGKLPDGDDGDDGDKVIKKSVFANILQDLKRTRDATIDAQGGAKELMRILGGAKDLKAFNGIDQQLSNLGANSDFIDFVGGLENAVEEKIIKINKKGIVSYGEFGEAAKKAYDEKQLGLFSAKSAQAINESIKQRDAFIKLKAAGVETADAQEMLADATFMVSLAAQKNPEEIRKMIAEYKNMKLEIQKTLEETDPEKAFDIEMDKAMKYYDFLEKAARAAAKPEIDRIEKLIEVNDKLIEGMQRKIEENYDRPIEKFNQDLAIMDKAAQGINDKYDAQEKALEKISSINEEISQQEKGRLTLADALSQGDIAAAARAAQEIRAEAAQSAMEKSSEALKTAREAELAGLTVGGLTRTQIEEKIYNLEQARLPILASIRDLQDTNYNLSKKELEPITEALKIRIDNIDTARTAWENQKLAIQKAGFEADKTSERFNIAESIVNKIKKLWEDIKDKNITLTINTVNTGSGLGSGGNGTPGTTFKDPNKEILEAISEGKILMTEAEMIRAMNTGFLSSGGLVPKYFANGGLSRGTDTVPAMLTPGEFVMRKSAVDKFGPMLSAMNSPSFKMSNSGSYDKVSSGMNSVVDNSSAMYNYNIGITVPQSNANPNDIANAVIGQIKYIDAQRIRGQR